MENMKPMIYESAKKNSNGWEYKELKFDIRKTNKIVRVDNKQRKTGGNNGILR